jgi:hypothetical protein
LKGARDAQGRRFVGVIVTVIARAGLGETPSFR